MDLEESRRPLQPTAVQAALEVAGWTGPPPVILMDRATTREAVSRLGGSGAADLSAVVLGPWGGVLGPFSGDEFPSGSALVVSMLVAGPVGADDRWLPLLGTLAAADALRSAARVNAEVAWPDGITVPGAMCGGEAGSLQVGAVRTDRVDPGLILTVVIVVGISSRDLPARTSSIFSEGGAIDRTRILGALLPQLARRVAQWRTADTGLHADYRDHCQTLGRIWDSADGRGQVSGVDHAGNLLVSIGDRSVTLPPPDLRHDAQPA